jgi:ribosomal subunit interface protein
MKIDVKATGIELTDAIHSFIQEKMDTLDNKAARFGDVVRAEVEVGKISAHHKKGPVYRAEVHVRLPGKVVYVTATNYDLYVAINDAKKEAEREIVEYKDTFESKKKRGA